MKKVKISLALSAALLAGPALAQLGGIGGGVGGGLSGGVNGAFGSGRGLGSSIGAGADSAFEANARIQRDLERQARLEKAAAGSEAVKGAKVDDAAARKVEAQTSTVVNAGAAASHEAASGGASHLESLNEKPSAASVRLTKVLPENQASTAQKESNDGSLLASDKALAAGDVAETVSGSVTRSENAANAEGKSSLASAVASGVSHQSDAKKSRKAKPQANGQAKASGKGKASALAEKKALHGDGSLASSLAGSGKVKKGKPAKRSEASGQSASAAPAKKHPPISAAAHAEAGAKGSVQVAENRQSGSTSAQKSR